MRKCRGGGEGECGDVGWGECGDVGWRGEVRGEDSCTRVKKNSQKHAHYNTAAVRKSIADAVDDPSPEPPRRPQPRTLQLLPQVALQAIPGQQLPRQRHVRRARRPPPRLRHGLHLRRRGRGFPEQPGSPGRRLLDSRSHVFAAARIGGAGTTRRHGRSRHRQRRLTGERRRGRK